jgi:hypothetical protein
VTSYDITGDRDAGTTIELPSEPSAEASLRVVREKAGNLLIVSMAGMVAETLRFGDSEGTCRRLCAANRARPRLYRPTESYSTDQSQHCRLYMRSS